MTQPEIVHLYDASSGDRVSILVSQGFNCFSWTRELESGQSSESLIFALPGHESGTARASSGGIPILFPFPGRIPGTRFEWDGIEYELEPSDKFGNAIHGFVHTRPWKLIDHGPTHASARFDSQTAEGELSRRWPGSFELTSTYRLHGDSLRFELEAFNSGSIPLPFGLGLHPYFRSPIHAPDAEQETVTIPVERHWTLEKMLPTGRTEADPFGLASGRPLADLRLDDVFDHGSTETITGDRTPDASRAHVESMRIATISGPLSRLEIRYDTDFPYCVAFTPPHREAICIEPYTCLPGSAAAGEAGRTTGLRILQPNQRWSTAVEYRWLATEE